MFDYHLHSNVSHDAYDSPVRIAMVAKEKGLTEICFTDHQEIDYPYPEEGMVRLDYTLYDRELDKARERVPGIGIKRGVEVSLMPGSLEKIARDVRGQAFDFVIASQHTIQGKDPYFGDSFEGKTLRQAQRDYLEEMLFDLAHYEDFDVVGHIGYLDKYLPNIESLKEKTPFEYMDFPDLLDGILKSAISRGKGIEVNTSNYSVYEWPTPIRSVLKRFRELGGEIVTLGSDAHMADKVGYRFRDAVEYMKECGVKYVCKFTARTPEFVPLEKF
ncbi:histidinol-phosphatase HisJ family protein [Christensenella intestinihominis]|uniref:histidinol-phosphatase HisJ family protein n=1 Tax=Christensenella intestinihominis TaxID=1851429 RepID=UPI000832122C|nr:histidinol-phosphatase HisJ family protein [Christensenella intestinihominis]